MCLGMLIYGKVVVCGKFFTEHRVGIFCFVLDSTVSLPVFDTCLSLVDVVFHLCYVCSHETKLSALRE